MFTVKVEVSVLWGTIVRRALLEMVQIDGGLTWWCW